MESATNWLVRKIIKTTNPLARFIHHKSQVIDDELVPSEVISSLLENRRASPDHERSNATPNPEQDILTAEIVTDFGEPDYIADPFLFRGSEDRYHLFFEVFDICESPTAAIGHAVSRGSGWEYDQIVLETDTHLSFPFVFLANGEVYMFPDQKRDPSSSKAILYRAEEFPTSWRKVATPVSPSRRTSDHVIVRWKGRWWCLVGHEPSGSLYCYHSSTLERDDWKPHPENPVVEERPESARPAGRPHVLDDAILIFYQDCSDGYGKQVYPYEITQLTTAAFEDSPVGSVPVLQGTNGIGWNSGRMHHIDVSVHDSKYLVAVDGDIDLGRGSVFGPQWSVGVFTREK